MKRIFQLLASFVALVILTACGAMNGPGAYEAGLNANVQQYKLFSDGQLAQQQTLITCFQHNPNKSECSILTASTNAVSTLAGQPQPLRIAKSTGEILETIADKGLEAAKVIYGVRAVSDAVQAQAKALKDTAAAGSAAQTATAQAGIEAASKPPLVVRPEVIQVPAGSSVLPVTPAE